MTKWGKERECKSKNERKDKKNFENGRKLGKQIEQEKKLGKPKEEPTFNSNSQSSVITIGY